MSDCWEIGIRYPAGTKDWTGRKINVTQTGRRTDDPLTEAQSAPRFVRLPRRAGVPV